MRRRGEHSEIVRGGQGVGEAVNIGPFHLTFLPDRLKTKGMCERIVEKYPYSLEHVPGHFKTGELCLEAVHKNPYTLGHVPD